MTEDRLGDGIIDSIAKLEAVTGRTPPAIHLKVIDHLDEGALRWLAQSPLAFVCLGSGLDTAKASVIATICGGVPGFAWGDTRRLRIPLASLDNAEPLAVRASFGSLFLIPGIREALRINGRLEAMDAEHLHVVVEECYGHCAKAIIRSDLWAAQPCDAPADLASFVTASRFLALATVGAGGQADLSPKGDPAGCMAMLDGDRIWFADRPGNRRVDSFRNIVEQSQTGIVLLVPGATHMLTARGSARLATDLAIRDRFATQGKTPLLAIELSVETMALHASRALERASPWPVRQTSDIDPTKLFMGHIKLNKGGGVGAMLARASLSVPGMTGLLKRGLEKDYKDNLY
ncbi:pyridoxamine 5'-phosphate oxidase family protein [Sphingobium sp. AN641]|uniref:pyridoxamine 5'-phosphate oxidase family protein n=1 Tax=Sphingobium sp. AN641 TaxID=3133443 RepID=UPI0030BC287F